MKKTVALILAGGKGKRMDLLCHLRPKPALPFAGKFRVIDFALSNCVHSGIKDIAALVDYHRAHMAGYLEEWRQANGNPVNLRVLPPHNGSYTGTADAVYQNLGYLEALAADTALILAGDHVYKMDYRKMLAFHNAVNADVTVGVVRVPKEETHRFGTVTLDAEGRITEFVEKSTRATSDMASMGIYIFNKELLMKCLAEDARQPDSPHDFGFAILPRLVKKARVFAFQYNGYWQDIGTMEAYYEASMELLVKQPRYTLDSDWPILCESNRLTVHAGDRLDNIVNSMISPGCVIEGRVENSVLSPGVYVGEQAVVRNSVVMANTSIGYHSVVDRCILDEGSKIGKFCYVGFGAGASLSNGGITLLGKGVTVPDYTAIGRKCKVMHGVGPNEFNSRLVPAGTVLIHS
jgi:glucose-1-phosphate adenylyltransferase